MNPFLTLSSGRSRVLRFRKSCTEPYARPSEVNSLMHRLARQTRERKKDGEAEEMVMVVVGEFSCGLRHGSRITVPYGKAS